MKIKKFEIDGFRSLKNVKINDFQDINIFHGENNTGKSNILRSLELFFSEKYFFKLNPIKMGEAEIQKESKEINFEGKVAIEESDFYIFEKNSIKFFIELELENKDLNEIKKRLTKEDSLKLLSKKTVTLNISAEIPRELEEHYGILYGNFKIISFKIDKKDILTKSTYAELINIIETFLIGKFSNIGSERQIIQEISEGEKENRIGDKNIQKYLYNLSISDNINDRLLLEKIITKFNEINKEIGKITFSIKPFKSKEHIEQDEHGLKTIKITDRNEIKLMIESTKDEFLLPIEKFGSGVQQSLLIIANVIADNKATLYGIEELEANLSPHNQEVIFNTIRQIIAAESFNINQVFITSHSDVFSKDKVKDGNVYMVKLEEKKTSVGRSEDLEYVKFFRQYQIDDPIYHKIKQLYGKHKIGTDNLIDGINARDVIDEQIFNEIKKQKCMDDEKKIDKIIQEYEKKFGKEIIITK